MKEHHKVILVMALPWICAASLLVATYYGDQIDRFFQNLLKILLL